MQSRYRLQLCFVVYMRPTNQSRLSYSATIDPSSGPSTTLEAKNYLAHTASRRVPPSVDGGPAGYRPRVLSTFIVSFQTTDTSIYHRVI